MKYLITTIAAVVLVGCKTTQQSVSQTEKNSNPIEEGIKGLEALEKELEDMEFEMPEMPVFTPPEFEYEYTTLYEENAGGKIEDSFIEKINELGKNNWSLSHIKSVTNNGNTIGRIYFFVKSKMLTDLTGEELEAEGRSISENKSESFIPKSDTKLSAEEIRKVLMLLVGESVGQGDVNYSLEETQVSFKIQRRLDWIKGENTIVGISEVNFPNANVLVNHRIYYDHDTNLFIDEQAIGKNDTVKKLHGIWDAKNTVMNWYYDSNESRSIANDKFAGPRQSVSNGKSWKKFGLNWELSTSSNIKIEPKILVE